MKNLKSDTIKSIVLFFILPCTDCVYFLFNRQHEHVYTLTTLIDKSIPFCSIFIVPYIFWFFNMYSTIIYFMITDKMVYYRILACLFLDAVISYTIFHFYPTVILRPDINGGDFFTYLVSILYKIDKPFNCFPSMHVSQTVIVTLFILNHHRKMLLKYMSIVICILIMLSTLFIKQHYFYDVISGTFLGAIIYFSIDKFTAWATGYQKEQISGL